MYSTRQRHLQLQRQGLEQAECAQTLALLLETLPTKHYLLTVCLEDTQE